MQLDTKDVVRVDLMDTGHHPRAQIVMNCGCTVTLRADGVTISQVICGTHLRREMRTVRPVRRVGVVDA